MDIDVQLQVTDKELEEFPEESTTNSWDTRSPTRQLLTVGKETLVQLSDSITVGKKTLIQLGVPATLLVPLPKGSLIQPSVPVPPLLTLQPQPELQALI